MIERYSLSPDRKRLNVLFTVDDPLTFTKPWSARADYKPDDWFFEENVCAENNRPTGPAYDNSHPHRRESRFLIMTARPPLPPFTPRPPPRKRAWPKTRGTAAIRRAWRSPIPRTAAGAIAANSLKGASAIVEFLNRKWAKELDYRLIKEVWAFHGNRIAVRFQYEWHDADGTLVSQPRQRAMGIRRCGPDAPARSQHQRCADCARPTRKFLWPLGPRPADHPGLTELGL